MTKAYNIAGLEVVFKFLKKKKGSEMSFIFLNFNKCPKIFDFSGLEIFVEVHRNKK